MKVFVPKVKNGNPNNKRLEKNPKVINKYSIEQINIMKAHLAGTFQMRLKK